MMGVRMQRILFTVLVATIPLQLGYHFWPEWSVVLGRRIDYLSPTLYATDIIIFVMLFLYAVNILVNRRGRSMYPETFYPKHHFIVVLVCILIGLNIVFAREPLISLYAWSRVLLYTAVVWFMYRVKPRIEYVIDALSYGVAYVSVLAVFQFILQRSVGGLFWFLGERTFTLTTPGIARLSFCLPITGPGCSELLRAYGTFPHPNVLGGFLAVSIPLIVYRVLFLKGTSLRIIWYGMVLLFSIPALITSFSRSAWFVSAAGILFVAYIYHGKQIRKTRMTWGIAFLVAGFGLMFGMISIILLLLPGFHSDAVVTRLTLSYAALRIWQDAPFTGAGLMNFIVVLPEYSIVRASMYLQPVHNIYLLILSETGILGIACIALSALILLRRVRKYIRVQNSRNAIMRGMHFLPLCSLLLLGISDHYPLTLAQGQLLLSISSGLALSLRKS